MNREWIYAYKLRSVYFMLAHIDIYKMEQTNKGKTKYNFGFYFIFDT